MKKYKKIVVLVADENGNQKMVEKQIEVKEKPNFYERMTEKERYLLETEGLVN
jgi:hypothetical protein